MSGLAPEIRLTWPEDAEAIVAISRAVGVFTEEEIATVQELLDEYQTRGAEASGYHFLTCVADGCVVGFACYGPRALTLGTFDFYWLATDPAMQGRGIGGALAVRCADAVKSLGGRLLIVETSGLPSYQPTRRFHEAQGYTRDAVIKDFYAPGDDLVIYVLRL